ncbi:hypothetical protein [Rickettsia monacensis]|nr:hypothetical protein [Rickettsia monacensis]
MFLWPPWSSHGVTQWVLPVHATMPCERLQGAWQSRKNNRNSDLQNV